MLLNLVFQIADIKGVIWSGGEIGKHKGRCPKSIGSNPILTTKNKNLKS
jgi:hypothetical protein